MFEFRYDYLQPTYGRKVNLCYMDTDSFVCQIFTDITNDVETKFDTGAYSKDDNRLLPIRKTRKVIGMVKDELGGKTKTKFVALRGNMYSYKKTTSRKIIASKVQNVGSH